MHIEFWGATSTVTGSKYLVRTDRRRVLIDCGMFQGVKALRLKNRAPFPVGPADLDAVVLTHAHLDHSGMLPALVKAGFKGPVYCTPPTRDLLHILLRDAGRIQEEDAAYANRKGYSRHHPAEPLYTEEDAVFALERLRPVRLGEDIAVGDITMSLHTAGHIIGAAGVHVVADGKSAYFSGDVGRPHDPLLPPPAPPPPADVLVCESTYGDRLHPEDPAAVLRGIVDETMARGGVLLIPSFAVGRAQTLLYHLHQINNQRGGLRIPVYVNSPMATSATEIFLRHPEAHRLDPDACRAAFGEAVFVGTVDDSKALSRRRGPMVIVSASGMLTGGRVLHHLKALGPDPQHTILLCGYQAAGTRGARLLAGERTIKIHGHQVPIRARVEQVGGLSAHADRDELTAWVASAAAPPGRVMIVHGEPQAADAFRAHLADSLGLSAFVAETGEAIEVGG